MTTPDFNTKEWFESVPMINPETGTKVYPDYVVGFEPWEYQSVVKDYVCAVCHGQLVAYDVPEERFYIIVCPEHGNVEVVGRVRREYVSREMENSHRQFGDVIRNLPEFWGELIQARKSESENLKDLGF